MLKAFVHGDGNLLNNYPELQEALVWVYFHSNISEFNKVECWGPLKDAAAPSSREIGAHKDKKEEEEKQETQLRELPEQCQQDCDCCFPPINVIPWSQTPPRVDEANPYGTHPTELSP